VGSTLGPHEDAVATAAADDYVAAHAEGADHRSSPDQAPAEGAFWGGRTEQAPGHVTPTAGPAIAEG
jgi:hypothetical protein